MQKKTVLLFILLILGIIAAYNMRSLFPGPMRYLVFEDAIKSKLQMISMAVDLYSKYHDGHYPLSVDDLISANPPYLTVDFFDFCHMGTGEYHITCDFKEDGYSFSAQPKGDIEILTQTYTITTGGFKEPLDWSFKAR
ncbi:MAG: hypothetical protein K8S27_12305 [Candidatus Omnitrophica bacterium]|nr:hypothetical protein [Candidatus Omnitrophota bacterium]